MTAAAEALPQSPPSSAPSRQEAQRVMTEAAARIIELRRAGRHLEADVLTEERDAYGRAAARYFDAVDQTGGPPP